MKDGAAAYVAEKGYWSSFGKPETWIGLCRHGVC